MLVLCEIHGRGRPNQVGKCGIKNTLSKAVRSNLSVAARIHILSVFLLFVLCVFVALPAPSLACKLPEDRDRYMEISINIWGQ